MFSFLQDFGDFPCPGFQDYWNTEVWLLSLSNIPGFRGVENDVLPINANLYKKGICLLLSMLVNKETTIDFIKSENWCEIVFNSHEKLLSFSNFSFDNMDFFLKVPKYIESLRLNERIEYLANIVRIVSPFILQCPYLEYSDIPFVIFVSKVKEYLPDCSFLKALKVKSLCIQAIEQSKQNSYVSTILKPVSSLLQSIFDSSDYDSIIPYLCPSVAQALWESFIHVFSKIDWNNQELLACSIIIPNLFLCLSSMHPPSLASINWKAMAKYFSRVSDSFRYGYPNHVFLLDHPEFSKYSHVAESVTALMVSFYLIIHILPAHQEKEYNLCILNSISTKNTVGQNAVAQAFFNVFRFKHFISIKDYIIKAVSEKNYNMAYLYVNSLKDNYTRITNCIELYYRLSPKIYALFDDYDLKYHSSNLSNIICPTISPDMDLLSLSRSVDGLLHSSSYFVYSKLCLEDSLKYIYSFIFNFMKKGYANTDMRYAIPFAHLCSSFVQLITKYGVNDIFGVLGLNIEFVLSMFDHMATSSSPVVYGIHEFNSITASIYIERLRFSHSIAPFLERFFKISTIVINENRPSLRLSALLLLNDVLSLKEINVTFLSNVISSISGWITTYFLCESEIIHNIVFSLMSKVFSLISGDCLTTFLSIIITYMESMFFMVIEKSSGNDRVFNRIMHHFVRLTSIPDCKTVISAHPQYLTLVSICIHCLGEQFARSHPLSAVLASDALLSMCSHSVTSIPHVDVRFRFVSETIDYRMMEPLVTTTLDLIKHMESTSIEVINHALRLIRYCCENPYWVKVVIDKGFILEFEYIKTTKIWDNDDFCGAIIEMAYAISKFDKKFAAEFIGYPTCINDIMLERFDSVPERDLLLNVLKDNKPIRIDLKISIEEAQKVLYKDPTLLRRKLISRHKSMIHSGFYHLTELKSDHFFKSFEVEGTTNLCDKNVQ